MPDMQQLNPYSILDNNLTALQGYYKNKIKTLQGYGLNPDQYNQIMMEWQEEYDARKFKIISARLQLDDIKLGVDAGKIDPMAGEQAMMGLVLPEDTYNAMYPKQQAQRGRFTPNEYNSYVKEFTDAIGSTVVKPWTKRNYADPEQLKEQYFANRVKYGYDTDMNVPEKQAFDLAWDQAASSNKKTLNAWKNIVKNDPEVMMSRTYDARLLEIAKKKATGQSISPMAKALQKKPKESYFGQAAKQSLNTVNPLAYQTVEKFLSDRNQKKEQQSMPRVTSDDDYDKLKSGTQFIDPNGNIRTKP